MAYPVEAPSIPPPWTVEDVRSFLVGYGRRPRELAVTQLHSWWFNLVLRVEADGETLVLRRYGVTPPEEVRWELAVLAHLRKHHFPTLAPISRSKAPGDGLSEFLGKPAILYPYVEGHSGRDLDWSAALVPTAEVVARLHALTEHLALPFPRVRSGTESRRIVRQLLDLAAERGVATHERVLSDLVTRAQRALASFEARLTRDGTDLPRSVVHHDAHRGNLLFRDGQLVALIDFDDAHYGYQVADVAVMVENWAGEGEPEGRLSLDKAIGRGPVRPAPQADRCRARAPSRLCAHVRALRSRGTCSQRPGPRRGPQPRRQRM